MERGRYIGGGKQHISECLSRSTVDGSSHCIYPGRSVPTNQVIICDEQMTEFVCKGRTVSVADLDFSKTLASCTHNIILSKLQPGGVDT